MDKTPKFGPTDCGWDPPYAHRNVEPDDNSCFDLGSINAKLSYAPPGESPGKCHSTYPTPVRTTGDPMAGK